MRIENTIDINDQFLTHSTKMTASQSSAKLNEAQLTLLKLLNVGLTEQQVEDIRALLMTYLEKDLFQEIDRVVEEKQYTVADFERVLNQDHRTKGSL